MILHRPQCSARAVTFVSTLHKPGTREVERGQRTCKQPSKNSGTSGNKTLTTLFFFKLFFFPVLVPLNSWATLFCQHTIFLSIMISPWLCLQWLCWPPLCMFVINVFILLLNLVLGYGPWKKIGISCGKRFKLLLHENFTLSLYSLLSTRMGTEDHNLRCNRKQLEKMILNKARFGFVQILTGWYNVSWKNVL